MPISTAQRQALAMSATFALVQGMAQRTGAAQTHPLENASRSRGQTRMGQQELGQETAQHCAQVRPVASARRQMLADQLHGEKTGGA